ncbi:hypothetical protein ACSLO9_34810, partial [Escherichia coli]
MSQAWFQEIRNTPGYCSLKSIICNSNPEPVKRGTDINTRRIPASNCLSARNAELKHDHTGARILWS